MAFTPERIRALRKLCGWNQTHLAKRLFVTQITVSNWERGTHAPSLVHRKALEQLLRSVALEPEGE